MHDTYLAMAVELARDNVERGGRPFGAVLAAQGGVLARGVNQIAELGDPTAHAEVQAIRQAAQTQGAAAIAGATMYASGHPCPMCLAAMYLTGVTQAYYAFSQADGEAYGLSTAALYTELQKPLETRRLKLVHRPQPGPDLYASWQARQARSPKI